MWHGMENMGWGWLGLGALHMVVFWAIVIGAIVLLVPWRGDGSDSPDPLEILKRRYAKGELTREEFERMRREIADAGS